MHVEIKIDHSWSFMIILCHNWPILVILDHDWPFPKVCDLLQKRNDNFLFSVRKILLLKFSVIARAYRLEVFSVLFYFRTIWSKTVHSYFIAFREKSGDKVNLSFHPITDESFRGHNWYWNEQKIFEFSRQKSTEKSTLPGVPTSLGLQFCKKI